MLLPLSRSKSDQNNTKSAVNSSTPMGLRILINESSRCCEFNSTVVLKPSFIRPTTQFGASHVSGFLKTCYLCNKQLSPQMDVYMYRGEQGFCSVECRSRQIFLDEMEELEAATKETLRAYRSRHCQSNKARPESDRRWRGIWAAPYSN